MCTHVQKVLTMMRQPRFIYICTPPTYRHMHTHTDARALTLTLQPPYSPFHSCTLPALPQPSITAPLSHIHIHTDVHTRIHTHTLREKLFSSVLISIFSIHP